MRPLLNLVWGGIPWNVRDAFHLPAPKSKRPSWMACAETIKENNATAAAVTPFVFHRFLCSETFSVMEWEGERES